jgi:hypothetical protein
MIERTRRTSAESRREKAVAERNSLVIGNCDGLRLSKRGQAIAKQIQLLSGATDLVRAARHTASAVKQLGRAKATVQSALSDAANLRSLKNFANMRARAAENQLQKLKNRKGGLQQFSMNRPPKEIRERVARSRADTAQALCEADDLRSVVADLRYVVADLRKSLDAKGKAAFDAHVGDRKAGTLNSVEFASAHRNFVERYSC